ncbi:Uncharacterised protein [Niallia circulans]|nr:Uncharacterised protein [Niallia circulans]
MILCVVSRTDKRFDKQRETWCQEVLFFRIKTYLTHRNYRIGEDLSEMGKGEGMNGRN